MCRCWWRPHPVQQWPLDLSLLPRLLGGPHPVPQRNTSAARASWSLRKEGSYIWHVWLRLWHIQDRLYLVTFMGEYTMKRKRGLLMQRRSQTQEKSRLTTSCHALRSPTTAFDKSQGRVSHLTIGSSKNRAVITMNTIHSTIIVHAPMVMLSKVTPAHSHNSFDRSGFAVPISNVIPASMCLRLMINEHPTYPLNIQSRVAHGNS